MSLSQTQYQSSNINSTICCKLILRGDMTYKRYSVYYISRSNSQDFVPFEFCVELDMHQRSVISSRTLYIHGICNHQKEWWWGNKLELLYKTVNDHWCDSEICMFAKHFLIYDTMYLLNIETCNTLLHTKYYCINSRLTFLMVILQIDKWFTWY